ncbi:hypothetical protein H310_11128 [Aphanomyces invadans]|uniref:subtilisin n=1 Tax=Aphanomyces invadans TaxID=157072 RepID=A0A024TNX9_9STRA|nr:hypothetical protein H310_11128 [Aphanomyces invadans]ETV95714.1 hypothetical protein H310_11128 [Aphanomyces invadans]|eukprot:XP_008875907.1 hypothetical protein H310_11128 [Aphanomyces invadans]
MIVSAAVGAAVVLSSCAEAASSKRLLVHLHDSGLRALYEDLTDRTRDGVHAYLQGRFASAQASFVDQLSAAATIANVSMPQLIPLWIQNTVVLDNVHEDLELCLSQLDGVANVVEDGIVHLPSSSFHHLDKHEGEFEASSVQDNVKDLHADEAWGKGWSGAGIVIASIDSGVRYSHSALRASYRGTHGVDGSVNHDYAFWIPSSQNATLVPDNADEVGHGTHTMGTAVGSSGIGIAPNATWIAARPFNWDGSAAQSDILLAGQWVMCPTKWQGTTPNCTLGADIVSNSFGADSSVHWMDHVVRAWRRANMLPVFASGNVNGFQCGSVMCPGCLRDAVAVGALVGSKTLWGGSGKGPSPAGGAIKPDFVAPGVAIRSASSLGDAKYMRLTGTSMATPHVSGAAAIVWQACRAAASDNSGATKCSVDVVAARLERTATTQSLHKPVLVPATCGGTPYNTFPNNIYGFGLPNTVKAAAAPSSTANAAEENVAVMLASA